MKLKYSDDKKIFTVHRKGIPYLSSCMLDSLGVPNLFSTRFVSWDEEKDEGAEGLRTTLMAGDDISEAAPVIQDIRDRLAPQPLHLRTDGPQTACVRQAASGFPTGDG